MNRIVTVTLLLVAMLAVFTAPAHAQRVIVNPSVYDAYGQTIAVFSTTSTAGNATPQNIATTKGMIDGLTVNAGVNTAGTQVWVNFFNATGANVTAGTTAALFSIPVQAGGTSNATVSATVVPYGSPLGIPVSTALSFNCTTLKNGTIGTQVACNANVIWKP